MKIKICADSTCDLSPELVETYDVGIIPLYIVQVQPDPGCFFITFRTKTTEGQIQSAGRRRKAEFIQKNTVKRIAVQQIG